MSFYYGNSRYNYQINLKFIQKDIDKYNNKV